MRRFYEKVTTADLGNGFGVMLDNTFLRTPRHSDVILPNQFLADALAREWSIQKEEIIAENMYFTKIAYIAIDQVPLNRLSLVNNVLRYASHDLICYRASEPEKLAALQQEKWQPVLDWVNETFGTPMVTSVGVVPHEQLQSSIDVFRSIIEAYCDFSLSALQGTTSTTGSFLLSLAVARRFLSCNTAWTLSQLDSDFQAQRWGRVPESVASITEARAMFDAAAFFLAELAA